MFQLWSAVVRLLQDDDVEVREVMAEIIIKLREHLQPAQQGMFSIDDNKQTIKSQKFRSPYEFGPLKLFCKMIIDKYGPPLIYYRWLFSPSIKNHYSVLSVFS